MNIGPYLKQLRQDKGYTLNEVSSTVGMSASFLSQIENMKLSPSLDSLDKLLSFYAVNLSDFFRQVEQRRVIIVKREETQTFDVSDNAIRLTLLASKLQNNSLETFIVKFFKKGASINTAVLPKEINGERLIYIIKGSLLFQVENEAPVTLAHADSINFKSYIPCSISASGEEAELLISGMPPLIIADYNKP